MRRTPPALRTCFPKRERKTIHASAPLRFRRGRIGQALGCLALLFLAIPGWALRVSVVLEEVTPGNRPIVAALQRAGSGGYRVTVHELKSVDLADPILKGRFLAPVIAADVVVPVGEVSMQFVTDELTEIPIFFVGVGLVKGEALLSPDVGGILSYNVREVMSVLKTLPADQVGVVYTRGYERVLTLIREEAKAAAITLVEKKVSRPADTPAAYRDLFPQVQAVWVLGDPLIARGAGFRFLIEQSLSRKVPVAGNSAWAVEHGALFYQEPDPAALGAAAAALLDQYAKRKISFDRLGIRSAPPGGQIVINRVLARRWQLLLDHIPAE
jgi:hypothetical protein